MMNFADLYSVGVYTYFVVFVGILCLNLGLLLKSAGRPVSTSMVSSDQELADIGVSRGKKIFWLQFVMFVVLIPLFLRALQFQSEYGIAMMRTIYAKSVEYGYMNTFERILYIHLGVFPLNMACILAQAILCMRGESKLPYLVVGVVNEGMQSVIASSRNNFFELGVILICALLMSDKSLADMLPARVTGYIKRTKRFYKRLLVVVVIVLLVLTYYRHNIQKADVSVVNSFMGIFQTYFAGGFQLLDLALNDPSSWGLDSLTLGGATFCGLIQVVNYFVYYLLSGRRLSLSFLSPNIQAYAEQFYMVSDTKKMNAYVTMFYYFMRDFGIVGVVVLSIVFGYICAKAYRRMRKCPIFMRQFNYVMLLVVIVFSVEWWQPIKSDWWMMLAYGWIINKWLFGDKRFVLRIHKR
jgi:oligosaccharide repeat unit polymerase